METSVKGKETSMKEREISIKEKEIQQLLKIEELFHSHYLTEELLHDLVSLYVSFVENIHHHQHPIRIYFMEKIKFVLSRPEVVRILEKETTTNNRSLRETVRGVMGVSAEEEAEMKRMAEEAKAEVRQNHLVGGKRAGDQALREKERSVKLEMQLRIMEEVESNMAQFRRDLSRSGEKQQQKEAAINKLVNEQDSLFNQRLANRKKRQRKKSADLAEKETVAVEPPPPIPLHQLRNIQKEVQQTYERFTRLTQQKMTRLGTLERRENEGRVKFHKQDHAFEEEEYFDQPNKKEEGKGFAKKKSKQAVEVKQAERAGQIERKEGRVTVRNAKYEQVEEEEFL